ncbi:Uma2 family endonuclease [Leptolyngbya cf. ectocarpi LEGE 11479]|uniref:Uma2 family endonuclease n=1 Tax=Leptolyngbya cf. ectocarpi LEGE 11479 TaxID=1828722 RepID=A0A929F7T3_LEPEC|nr:Uma2 family endonuclease [Leptolyngbya ectocarpi]MBE9068900.1 Uma2 family endonuclease [Leptolyngbya cf. ectocarpi LEGE 11479]
MSAVTLYSANDYLELEASATFKSEYHDGKLIPMTGGSTNHNQIIINLIAFLKFSLKGKGYRQFASDVRLWIPAVRRYTYPDLMIVQGEPIYHEDRTDTIENPTVIVEVLSKSTQDYDHGDKFNAYRTVATFQEYVLVNQYKQQVEHYVKTAEKRWSFREYDADDQQLLLEQAPFEISFLDLYDEVDFTLEGNEK